MSDQSKAASISDDQWARYYMQIAADLGIAAAKFRRYHKLKINITFVEHADGSQSATADIPTEHGSVSVQIPPLSVRVGTLFTLIGSIDKKLGEPKFPHDESELIANACRIDQAIAHEILAIGAGIEDGIPLKAVN